MNTAEFDTLVIGGGASGMAAALSAAEEGWKVVIVEREEFLGGILHQCIHNGFGLHYFKEELTGPEYAERFSDMVESSNITVYLNMTIMDIMKEGDGLTVYGLSMDPGMVSCSRKGMCYCRIRRYRIDNGQKNVLDWSQC